MAVMLLIMYIYYSLYLFPSYYGAVVEPGGSYSYEHEYPMYKRALNYEAEDTNLEDDYYSDLVAKQDDFTRNKRESQPAQPSTAPSQQQHTPKSNGSSAYAGVTNGGNATSTDAPIEDRGSEDLDFKLSNSLVNSIFIEAEKSNLKQPLGLCRRNEDIKTPEMNVTLFPLEQAQEIIHCINDLLNNQSKKHLCIELNEEMNAYLKWLILTGESKEHRKQIKFTAYKDEFLFPSTCGANISYGDAVTRKGSYVVHKVQFTDKELVGEGEVLTTCAPVNPVNPGKPSKSGKTDKPPK